ncbi:Cof-type HAD-IIB family hydrolase [Staphylococcus haemolyticus]|uniref:Cof-type HAD-IIB family hydrolase n=1 Tax=Staphylococcus haemolyticus TaxID=1283 RepID=UPI0018795BF2|nr:Cof-type HAD-IIB family hydrolase [Staphylococcus haemolyticus]MBE7355561.1 Cof-type HAD-IIB family hydrolase [Staphylococcus haemolyticus]MDT0705682.1 Cof-type HAD-IIB family hydrolase [Staphylococcus haemolyticus]MDT0738488.1 Cof-type HAD-IIB family hydrolase [Staphylococcus haemolyticus]
MFKLVVTDMDGTFLNSKSSFNREKFQSLLTQLRDKDIRFAFCTGKQNERVDAIVGDLTKDVFIIGDSASRIKINDMNIYAKTFNNQLGLELIKTIKQIDENLVIIVCTEGMAYAEKHISEKERNMVLGSYEKVTFVEDLSTIDKDMLKITIFDIQGQCFEHVKGLNKYEDDLYIVAAEENWIDITHKDVDKGKTIRFLQQLLNISSEQTIVFGDGLNDIPLFENARFKVAMDNAYPELKRKANLISIDNDRDGVIETLNTLLRNEDK